VLHEPGAAGPFIGAIDQGTTSTRFMLFSAAGRPVATAQREHRQIVPRSGWVEHDAEEVWARVEEVVTDCLRVAGASPSDVAGLGITNQRETVVVWDAATGAPLHNALVWQDQRGAALCAELARGHPAGEGRFRAATGLPLVPYFTASKLAWCLDNVPGLRAAAEAGTALAGTTTSASRLERMVLSRRSGFKASCVRCVHLRERRWVSEMRERER
jgi:glycerol kinase